MFEHLVQFSQILVTGPQRSGTRIAAKMIANDTGYRYVDETEFGVHSQKQFKKLLREEFFVVHCPGVNHLIHDHATEDNLVVMMYRDIEDIIASEERVHWFYGIYDELLKYGIPYDELNQYAKTGDPPISGLKYVKWENEQRDHIPNYWDLQYESLSKHPMWVAKEQRANFAAEQTE